MAEISSSHIAAFIGPASSAFETDLEPDCCHHRDEHRQVILLEASAENLLPCLSQFLEAIMLLGTWPFYM